MCDFATVAAVAIVVLFDDVLIAITVKSYAKDTNIWRPLLVINRYKLVWNVYNFTKRLLKLIRNRRTYDDKEWLSDSPAGIFHAINISQITPHSSKECYGTEHKVITRLKR